MALVKCPECGKENVSDTAESCPECGYAIKEHFARIARKEQLIEQENQFELKRKQESDKLQAELNQKLSEIDNMDYPKKPTFFGQLFHSEGGGNGLSYSTLIALIFSFLLGFVSKFFIVIFVLLLVLWTPFWLFITYGDYKSMLSLYEYKTSDFEKYKQDKKAMIKKEYDNYSYNMARYGSRIAPMPKISTPNNQMKCPVCGSTNISKISTLNRTVSVATVGLASSKIGKQYECKSCKHKW